MQLQENKAAASIATKNNCNGGIFLMYQIIIFRNDHKVKFLKLNIFHVVDFYFIRRYKRQIPLHKNVQLLRSTCKINRKPQTRIGNNIEAIRMCTKCSNDLTKMIKPQEKTVVCNLSKGNRETKGEFAIAKHECI